LTVIAFAFTSSWKISSDFYSILPESHELKEIAEAEKVWSSANSSKFFVFIGHENFETAKLSADSFCGEIQKSAGLGKINCRVPEFSLNDFKNFLFDYRYALQKAERLQNLNAEEVQREALGRVYGTFSFSSLENLEQDPFLLTENLFNDYLTSPALQKMAFTLKDGYRVFENKGSYFVFIDGALSDDVLAIAEENHIIGKMRLLADQLESKGVRTVFSGVPFHTYESSTEAKKEISLISTLSMILIVILLLSVFRTPIPILSTVTVIITSILFAASATKLIFGEIHTFTFIFGTTLIGISIDYSLHFFTHWKNKENNRSGFDVRKKIIKQVSIGFFTTQLSYVALVLMPFLLLKQMAFFSLAGLLSSFLVIQLAFPYLPLPKVEKQKLPLAFPHFLMKGYAKVRAIPKMVRAGVFVLFAGVLAFGIYQVNFKNDIRSLYKMSAKLLESEKFAAEILNHGSSGWFFIVKGNSAEELLQKEEAFRIALDSMQQENILEGYVSLSQFLPSLKHQAYSYETVRERLLPESARQFELLGLSDSAESKFLRDFELAATRFLTFDKIPETLSALVSNLQIGKVGEEYFSVILPLREKDRPALKQLASRFDSVYFVDKIEDIGNELTRYSQISLLMIFAVYVFIFFVLLKFYALRQTLLIIATPLLSVLTTIAVFGYLGRPFNFFAVAGIILTLGIGIDYVLFFSEKKKNYAVTMLAVFLSMVTTELSFGALSLSSFAPVSQFGLSVFLGILFCFLFAPFVSQKQEEPGKDLE
jgi:predicted exporter